MQGTARVAWLSSTSLQLSLESYSTLATRARNEQKRSLLSHTGHNRSQGADVESFGRIC